MARAPGVGAGALGTRSGQKRSTARRQSRGRPATAQLLAAIVESSDDAIVSKSLDGVIRSWNAAAERMFGYTAQQAIGHHISLIIPRERLAEEDQILARLRAGQRLEHFETVRVRKDGGRLDVSLTISPVKDRQGRIAGASKICRDITVSKRAEAALRDREERLRLALHAGEMGAWEWNVNSNEVLWSPELEAIHGLAPGSFARTFDAFQSDIHPEDRERVLQAVADALQRGQDHLIEYRIVRPDGSVRWVEGRGKLYRDADGTPARMIGVCTDVTRRKVVEERVRRSEQELTDLFETASIGLHWIGPDGIVIRVNQAQLDMLGYSRDEFVGHRISEFHADPQAIDAMFARVRHGGRLHEYAARMRCKDGSLRNVLVSSSVLFDEGRVVHIRSFTQDVTERKQAEQALKGSQARLAAEATSLTHLAESSARLWRIASLRDGLAEMLGAAIELLGADKGHVQLLDASGRLRIEAQRGFDKEDLHALGATCADGDSPCSRALRAGTRVVVADLKSDTACAALAEVARATGLHALQTTPLLASDGTGLGLISTYFAEPHRPSEADLYRLDLYVRQAGLFIDRYRADEAQREGNRRKDEFLATLAHELRNPLAALRNGLQLVRLAGTRSDLVDQSHRMMERQLQQLVRLIDDLLDLSRITRGQIRLHRQRVALADVLHLALETSRPLLEKAGHELSVEMPDQPLLVDGDEARLAQAVSNLLSNAAKFSTGKGHVWLTLRHDGEQAVVGVRDDGIGIGPEAQQHLFEMFWQADRTAYNAEGGLGIGLSLVKNLVELHGGSVHVRSEGHGRGSEFLVRLPLARSAAAQMDASGPFPGARPERRPERRRILVADDNRDAAVSLVTTLDLMGHEVRAAFDGREALEAAEAFKPEIVLLDIGMPRLNGYDAARLLRTRLGAHKTVLVALTGWGQDDDRRRSRDAGFDHHLVKPVELKAIEAILATLPKRTSLPDARQVDLTT